MSITLYDVILIGAGSIGVPTALYLAQKKLRVLVLEKAPSIGQGSNKAAIGGVRATHSNPAKVSLSLASIDILSSWQDTYGDDIEWIQGGYSFVAYDTSTRESLQQIVQAQKSLNTGLQWLPTKELLTKIPSLTSEGLLGGTYAPNDGSASPLKTISAFYRQAKALNVSFRFSEPVVEILHSKNTISGVRTTKDTYTASVVINAAGFAAAQIAKMTGTTLPVRPNIHEAGVTEPVQRFLEPMIVDTRSIGQSSSIYFYQHSTGQIIFCLTPSPPIWDSTLIETSSFLPTAAQRILKLVPALRNIKVRRTWSGYYPMTPDGSPLVGWDKRINGLLIAAGMCGQGFMLGPGMGQLLARMITNETTQKDEIILSELNPYREFSSAETLE